MKYLLSKFLGAALMSMLVIGSVSPTSTAQAAPTRELVYFSMEVQNPKTTLRCGQTVTYLVVVEVAPSHGAPTPAPGSLGFPRAVSLMNVKVEALSVNKTVGDFVGTATAQTAVALDDDLTGLAAKFKFKANKPGKTTLYFEGLVGKEYVSAKLDVKVLPCKFKVNTVSKWSAGMTSVGIMDAEMESDENGSFTGTATVNWVTSILCGIASPIAPGQADLTGMINDSGQLVGEITFGPMTSVGGGSCGVGITTENFGTLEPLTIEASSDGVSVYTQAQAVAATNGSFTGTATIVVIPEADEVAAFIPGSHGAIWNNFSSLLSTLLALP